MKGTILNRLLYKTKKATKGSLLFTYNIELHVIQFLTQFLQITSCSINTRVNC